MAASLKKNQQQVIPPQKAVSLSQAIRQAQPQYIRVGRVRIAFYDSAPDGQAEWPGSDSAKSLQEPLILLHGFCSMSFTWLDVCDALAAQRRVIAVDLKGFGSSDKPDDDDYLMETHAEIVIGLLNLLGIEKAILIGHSMGGSVALRAAQLWPERIRRLIILNPAAYHFDKFPLIARIVLTVSRRVNKTLAVKVLDRLLKIPGMVEQRMRNAYHVQAAITAERIAGYTNIARNPGIQRVIISTLRRWDLRSIESNLPFIQHPVLIIAGEFDRVIPLRFSRQLAATLMNSDLEIFPCGHVPHEEMSAECLALIEKSLV